MYTSYAEKSHTKVEKFRFDELTKIQPIQPHNRTAYITENNG
jgi:hypothetical protein